MTCLVDFHPIRPQFETSQEEIFEWLIDAHSFSEDRAKMKEKIFHVGCKPRYIATRGHILKDFLHRDWEKMQIYRLTEKQKGIAERIKLFDKEVSQIFEEYFPDTKKEPDDLIHVSCTGYSSPSGAQKIVSKRGWKTTVTHAYHMGCYAAFPAIRMGAGFLNSGKNHVDIVHTEICSIHLNPNEHGNSQLVRQTLFADGFIKYSIIKNPKKPHFKILGAHEEIIPNSIDEMKWYISNEGFEMTLSKKVPILIANSLKDYLKILLEKAKFDESILQKAHFAIHPGGPKILQFIQEFLHLKDSQMMQSFAILKKYGNMSSATLPHIWDAILKLGKKDDLVVSLAFGPGLSISGSIMEISLCGF